MEHILWIEHRPGGKLVMVDSLGALAAMHVKGATVERITGTPERWTSETFSRGAAAPVYPRIAAWQLVCRDLSIATNTIRAVRAVDEGTEISVTGGNGRTEWTATPIGDVLAVLYPEGA